MAKQPSNQIDNGTISPDSNDCKIIKFVSKDLLKNLTSEDLAELREYLRLFNVWKQPNVFGGAAIYVDSSGQQKPLSAFICKSATTFAYGKKHSKPRLVFKSTLLKDANDQPVKDSFGRPTYILCSSAYFPDHKRNRIEYKRHLRDFYLEVDVDDKTDSQKSRTQSDTDYKTLAELEDSNKYEKFEYDPINIEKEQLGPTTTLPSNTISKWAKTFNTNETFMALVFHQIQHINDPFVQIAKSDEHPNLYKIVDTSKNYEKTREYVTHAQLEYMDLDGFMLTYYDAFMSEYFGTIDEATDFVVQKCNDLFAQDNQLASEYFYKLDNMLFFRQIGDKSGELLSDRLIPLFPAHTEPKPKHKENTSDTTSTKKAVTKKLSSWVLFYKKKYPSIDETFMENVFNTYSKYDRVGHKDGSKFYTIYVNEREMGKAYILESFIKQKYERNNLLSLWDLAFEYYKKYGYDKPDTLYNALENKCDEMLSDSQFDGVTQLYFFKDDLYFFHDITDAAGNNRIDEFIQEFLGKTPVQTNEQKLSDESANGATQKTDSTSDSKAPKASAPRNSKINTDWINISHALEMLKDIKPLLGFSFNETDLIGTEYNYNTGYVQKIKKYLIKINDGRKITDFVKIRKYPIFYEDPASRFSFNVNRLTEFRNLMAQIDHLEAEKERAAAIAKKQKQEIKRQEKLAKKAKSAEDVTPAKTANKLDLDIRETNLSNRTKNCLLGAGINTIGELIKMTEYELYKIKGFGRHSMIDINAKLGEMDLKLVKPDLSKIRIEDLRSLGHAKNLLLTAGINTVGELIKMTEQELSAIPGLGRSSLWKIVKTLNEMDLKLSANTTAKKASQNGTTHIVKIPDQPKTLLDLKAAETTATAIIKLIEIANQYDAKSAELAAAQEELTAIKQEMLDETDSEKTDELLVKIKTKNDVVKQKKADVAASARAKELLEQKQSAQTDKDNAEQVLLAANKKLDDVFVNIATFLESLKQNSK